MSDVEVTTGRLPGARRVQGETVRLFGRETIRLVVDRAKFRSPTEEVVAVTEAYMALVAPER